MRTVLSRSVLGAMLVTLVLGPALAHAAPGVVSVRVEGSTATLLPPTLAANRSGSFSPIADPGHSCPGSSAANALELATLRSGTSWAGTFFSFGDYFVTSIAGERHPTAPSDGSYWNFWYDHAPAQLGICGQQLSPNDEILFFPDCFGKCPAGFVSPNVLSMTVPTIAQKGDQVTASVTSYASADGAQSPATNATVSGGGASGATSAAGLATLTFTSAGTFTLRADGPNAVRTEPHMICVHDGNDGNCGTPPPTGGPPPAVTTTTSATPPPSTAPPCVHHDDDGLCGTKDRTPPRAHAAIAEGTRFRHGHGPRVLAGRVDQDPSGLRDVLLRLTRVVTRGRCEAYDAKRRRFAAARCGVASAPSFSAGKKPAFSYLLPAPLSRGRYTLDVQAIDGAGNRDAPAPARNRIVFRVE